MRYTIIDNCQADTGWALGTDCANLTTNVSHCGRGIESLEFDKNGGTVTTGEIHKTLDPGKCICDFLSSGIISFYIYLSDLTNVASVDVQLGVSDAHFWNYQIIDTDLSTGWTHVEIALDIPESQTGNGADPDEIIFVQVQVNFDAVGNTLNDIRVNDIEVIDRTLTTT